MEVHHDHGDAGGGHAIVLGETPNSVEYRHGFRQITMGVDATAVYARELSRPARAEALRRQRADVRTRGVDDSPELELTATDGTDTVMIGGVLQADTATLTVTVRGAAGQTVDVVRNGLSTTVIPVPTDSSSVDVPMRRGDDGGPLGTFYRVDVREPVGIRSIVSNPMWLAATEPAAGPASPPPAPTSSDTPTPSDAGDDTAPTEDPRPLPATGAGPWWSLGLVGILATVTRWRRGRSGTSARAVLRDGVEPGTVRDLRDR